MLASIIKNEKGMTLFEIIIVLVIIVSVAGLLFKGIGANLDKARVNETKLRMSEVAKSVEQFNADCGTYPSALGDLEHATGNCSNWGPAPYIKASGLLDAWKKPFQYTNNGSTYTITSYGKDGSPGGEGVNKDIGSEDQ